MKITIYELLGLIKEGKAPKKVRRQRLGFVKDYELISHTATVHRTYKSEDGTFLMDLVKIYDEVEIIEEEKEIEKLSFCDFAITINENASNNDRILMDKINELIDVINDMRDRDENND